LQIKTKDVKFIRILQGSIKEIQKQYEFLSDIVTEAEGKVNGSQSDIVLKQVSDLSLLDAGSDYEDYTKWFSYGL
jgi:hypothetical protein